MPYFKAAGERIKIGRIKDSFKRVLAIRTGKGVFLTHSHIRRTT